MKMNHISLGQITWLVVFKHEPHHRLFAQLMSVHANIGEEIIVELFIYFCIVD